MQITFSLLLLLLAVLVHASDVQVFVGVDTTLSVNGEARVPPVFGLTAYGEPTDFCTAEGQELLKRCHVDYLGLEASLFEALPYTNSTLSPKQLQEWLSSKEAAEKFSSSTAYKVLSCRGAAKGGAVPFVYLTNPNGYCVGPELSECWPRGGTPRALNGSTLEAEFLWWSELFAGVMAFVKAVQPGLKWFHIWNEPNAHFYLDGFNGSYFTEFYVAMATRLKQKWPEVYLGGPVTWDVPNGPFSYDTPNISYENWFDYMKPIVDRALPAELLDFLDFHAYTANADPKPLMSAVNVVSGYTSAKYGRTMKVAITETNYDIHNASDEKDHTYHFNYRTFPLVLSTFALMKNPDLVLSRQIFDYRAPGKVCNCAFYSGPNSSETQEIQLYSILGMLAGCERVAVNISQVSVPSGCGCGEEQFIEVGGSPVLVEGGVCSAGENVTVAVVNSCDCKLTLDLRFTGLSISPLSSWAAVLDVVSLRDVPPPKWPLGTLTLPARSLTVISYQMKQSTGRTSNSGDGPPWSSPPPSEHFPTSSFLRQQHLLSFSTVHSSDSSTVMHPIPLTSSGKQSFNISIPFIVPSSLSKARRAFLRFGVLGVPGNGTWEVNVTCSSGKSHVFTVGRPGVYYEYQLTFIPQTSCTALFSLVDQGRPSVVVGSEVREMRDYSIVKLPSLSETQYMAVFQFGSLVFETLQATRRM